MRTFVPRPKAAKGAGAAAPSSLARPLSRPSGATDSLLHLQSVTGNRAVQRFLETGRSDLSRVPTRFTLDSNLSSREPAWTEKGIVHVGIAGLSMPPAERQRMLRHESVHALHQQAAGPGESAEARQHAETLAVRGEQAAGGLSPADFLTPAPARLHYPPQAHSPWSQVWIGYPGVLGEIVENGVTVRIFLSYSELGIQPGPEYKIYECGKHDVPPIPQVVKKMKQVAQEMSQMNNKMPATATAQRVSLVAIYGSAANSGYRVAEGKGLVVLGRDEFDAGTLSTVTHEGGHAIFEYHSVRGGAASARVPDSLALRIADLHVKLSNTKLVPDPTAKFEKKSPPPLAVKGEASAHPAGLVMVSDTLWSGAGGHPWDGVDEFFASAYAGFVREPALLREIIAYYSKFDPGIKPLAAELLDLLATVGKPADYNKLKSPKAPEAAQKDLSAVSPPPEFTKEHYQAGWYIDPTRMPSPDKIPCTGAAPSTPVDIDKLLEGMAPKPEK